MFDELLSARRSEHPRDRVEADRDRVGRHEHRNDPEPREVARELRQGDTGTAARSVQSCNDALWRRESRREPFRGLERPRL